MARREDAEAIAIYQGLMDIVDRAFTTRDADLHAQAIYLPNHIRTRKEVIHIRTQQELRGSFFRYLQFTESMGAVSHHREVLTARFRNKDAIEGVHTVDTLDANGENIIPQTRTTSIIMRMQGEWRVCGSDNTTEQVTGVGAFLRDLVKQGKVPNSASEGADRKMTGETS